LRRLRGIVKIFELVYIWEKKEDLPEMGESRTASVHPLVVQFRFTRSEFVRCLQGISPEDAVRRVMPLNCLSWIVGHLANQEQAYWLMLAQGNVLFPDLNEQVGYGKPASTPPLDKMWEAWQSITKEADSYLDTLTTSKLQTNFIYKGKARPETIGTMLRRNTYHYWYHTGEAHAIRDMLGHKNLPEFVGDMSLAAYQAEG
jgi:hypothetical protein